MLARSPLLSESTPLITTIPTTSTKASKIKERIFYYIPITSWLSSYRPREQFRGDFLAGLTVACLLIPQSISYATSLARLSPLTGLFSASVPALFYAIFGSSRHLNVAPEAALSLFIGQTIRTFVRSGDSESKKLQDAITITTVITFQEGLFAFLLGFFRLGFIDVVLSRALLRGFVTAIALIIAVEQLIPMLGLMAHEAALPSGPPTLFIDKAEFLITHLTHFHGPTSVVAFGALGVLVAVRLLKTHVKSYYADPTPSTVSFNGSVDQDKGIPHAIVKTPPLSIRILKPLLPLPEILLVILFTTLISSLLHLSSDPYNVSVMGRITVSTHHKRIIDFPIKPWDKSNWKWVGKTTGTSVLVSLIGYLDSVVAAKQNSDRFGYSVSSNREWLALGIANMGGSFVPGTLPAYGSITRSRLNADTGSSTQMSSLVTSIIILLTTFYLLPYLEDLPTCVLSTVVFLVVISLLVELPHDFKFYWKMRAHNELALMFLTFILTIAYNIEVGVLTSFVISLLMIVRKSSKVRISILGRVSGSDRWSPISENSGAEELPSWTGVLVIAIREGLDFANTAQLKERVRRLELFGHELHHPSERPRRSQARTLGFDMGDVESIDAAAAQILYELLETYKSRNIKLFLTRIHHRPSIAVSLSRSGIIPNVVPLSNVYSSLEEAERMMDLSSTRLRGQTQPQFQGFHIGAGGPTTVSDDSSPLGIKMAGTSGGVWPPTEMDHWREGLDVREVEAGNGDSSTQRRAGRSADVE